MGYVAYFTRHRMDKKANRVGIFFAGNRLTSLFCPKNAITPRCTGFFSIDCNACDCLRRDASFLLFANGISKLLSVVRDIFSKPLSNCKF